MSQVPPQLNLWECWYHCVVATVVAVSAAVVLSRSLSVSSLWLSQSMPYLDLCVVVVFMSFGFVHMFGRVVVAIV